jgi:hypothetical protein
MNRAAKSDFVEIVPDEAKYEKEPLANVTEDIHDLDETEELERERKKLCERDAIFSLPLAEFLMQALKLNETANSYLETCPYPESRWHSPAWTFTRLCKGHPNLEFLDAITAWSTVRTHLLRIDENEYVWDQLGADEDEAGFDFMYSWDKIRIHPAKDIITDAVDRAGRIALKPPVDRGQTFVRFVSIAGHLQAIRRDEPILVPVELFGNVLGCAKMSVSRMIKFAVADGLLYIVEGHDFARHKARRYRFAIERYPSL